MKNVGWWLGANFLGSGLLLVVVGRKPTSAPQDPPTRSKEPQQEPKKQAAQKQKEVPNAPGPGEEFLNVPSTKPKGRRGPTQRFYPFEWEASSRGPYQKALNEYEDYKAGKLWKEAYPYQWFVAEDFEILKTSPGRFVEIDMRPKLLSEVLLDKLPSWASIKWVGIGAVIMIAPEAMTVLGIEAEGAYTAAQLSKYAYQIATVIRESAKGTGATVAEIAAQLYSLQSPGLALGLGELVAHQLNTWGLRIGVKAAVSPFVD